MDYRMAILKELKKFYAEMGPPPNYIDINTLNTVTSASPPEKNKIVTVVNQLLEEGLLVAIGSHGSPAANLNPKRKEEVDHILSSSFYTDWRFIVSTIVALLGVIFAIVQIFVR